MPSRRRPRLRPGLKIWPICSFFHAPDCAPVRRPVGFHRIRTVCDSSCQRLVPPDDSAVSDPVVPGARWQWTVRIDSRTVNRVPTGDRPMAFRTRFRVLPRRPQRLRLESLEDRTTPATDITAAGGDFTITNAAGESANLTVGR